MVTKKFVGSCEKDGINRENPPDRTLEIGATCAGNHGPHDLFSIFDSHHNLSHLLPIDFLAFSVSVDTIASVPRLLSCPSDLNLC